METPNLLQNELHIDSRISNHLKETAGWARFLGILGIILAALLGIVAFVLPSIFMRSFSYSPYYSRYGSDMTTIMTGAITAVYLIAALLLFFVALFTFRFGSKTREALAMNDQASLDKGLMNLKFLFRFYGIIAVIYLAFIVLAILLGGLGAMMR